MNSIPHKILAVDDEELLLWSLGEACRRHEFDLKTAVSTRQAVEEVDKCRFDLFLLDFNLRDPSRMELLRALELRYPYVPIICMTTTSINSCELLEAIKSVRQKGAWYLMEKPFSLNNMISFIEMILRARPNDAILQSEKAQSHSKEKRMNCRRAYVQVVTMAYQSLVDGKLNRNESTGILTDISDSGLGLIAHDFLHPGQLITFKNSLQRHGFIAWCEKIEPNSYRTGVRLS